jgi:hypothetical protein
VEEKIVICVVVELHSDLRRENSSIFAVHASPRPLAGFCTVVVGLWCCPQYHFSELRHLRFVIDLPFFLLFFSPFLLCLFGFLITIFFFNFFFLHSPVRSFEPDAQIPVRLLLPQASAFPLCFSLPRFFRFSSSSHVMLINSAKRS